MMKGFLLCASLLAILLAADATLPDDVQKFGFEIETSLFLDKCSRSGIGKCKFVTFACDEANNAEFVSDPFQLNTPGHRRFMYALSFIKYIEGYNWVGSMVGDECESDYVYGGMTVPCKTTVTKGITGNGPEKTLKVYALPNVKPWLKAGLNCDVQDSQITSWGKNSRNYHVSVGLPVDAVIKKAMQLMPRKDGNDKTHINGCYAMMDDIKPTPTEGKAKLAYEAMLAECLTGSKKYGMKTRWPLLPILYATNQLSEQDVKQLIKYDCAAPVPKPKPPQQAPKKQQKPQSAQGNDKELGPPPPPPPPPPSPPPVVIEHPLCRFINGATVTAKEGDGGYAGGTAVKPFKVGEVGYVVAEIRDSTVAEKLVDAFEKGGPEGLKSALKGEGYM